MKSNIKLIVSALLKTILSVLLIGVAYFLCAFTLPKIPIYTQTQPTTEPHIDVYVISNGVHTDVALPSNSIIKNWESIFSRSEFLASDSALNYVAFGWGDKGFYLNTPEWSDLKISTAFNATFGLGGTAMHVQYIKEPQKLNQNKVQLKLSNTQYQKLVKYIEESFCYMDSCISKINHPGYGKNDLFYEANGKYSLIKTCNVWTNKALKKCGVKTGLWTPFASGLMSSIRTEE